MLTTDFIKIGQSGPTIDGRTIDPQWLKDAAELYDPDTYTAVIWVEHFRYPGNQGTVLALEVRENGDVTELWAKLRPGWGMLERNREGQKLFTSMELVPNFAETGKFYLAGLAITDEPASLGTEEIRLFSKQQGATHYRGVQMPDLFAAHHADTPSVNRQSEETPSWFRNFCAQLFGKDEPATVEAVTPWNPASPDTNQPEEDPMDKEQYTEMLGVLREQTDAVKQLAEKFTAAAESSGPETAPASAPATEDNGTQKTTNGSGDEISLTQLAESMKELQSSFATMAERMEGKQSGTAVPETTSPADGPGLL